MPPDIILTVSEENPEIELQIAEGETKPEESRTVVPNYERQTVVPRDGYVLGKVVVEPIPDPVSTLLIENNGEYDVRQVGTADVRVPQGVFPSGQLDITQNGVEDVTQYESVNVRVPQPSGKITITENGTDIDIAQYASADVNVSSAPEKGVVFEDFDSSGNPLTARVVGFTSDMPVNYLKNTFNTNAQGSFVRSVQKIVVEESISHLTGQFLNIGTSITEVVVKGDIYKIAQNAISNLTNLKSITFLGDIRNDNAPVIMASFGGNNNVMLYDFSHCAEVPTVFTGASADQTFGHASGCVFRVPQALLSEWQNADVWRDLTDIVWEGGVQE